MRVLLTGATGLVGPNVLRRLLERGDDVRVLAVADTVERLPAHPRLEVVVGDLSDADALAQAVRGVEMVYHLAARVLGASAPELFNVNVLGTENLLRACAEEEGIRRFLFVSSVAVYAPAPDPELWPITEASPLQAHGSEHLRNYGQSKIDGEALVKRYARATGCEYVVVRPPAVYAGDAPWAAQLVRQLRKNPWRSLTPSAQEYRMHWVHVRDLADGIVLAGTHPAAANETFNLAGPEVFTQATLLALLWRRALGGAGGGWGDPWFVARFDDDDVLKYDITKANEMLGYRPRVHLEKGLEEILAHREKKGPSRNGSAPGGRKRRRARKPRAAEDGGRPGGGWTPWYGRAPRMRSRALGPRGAWS